MANTIVDYNAIRYIHKAPSTGKVKYCNQT